MFQFDKRLYQKQKTRAETDSASAEEVCKTQAEEKAEIFDEKSNAEVDETSAIDVNTSKDDQDGRKTADGFLLLFWEYFKIGLFTIGGGYAMIPLVTPMVEKHGWMTELEIVSFIGVAEATPVLLR